MSRTARLLELMMAVDTRHTFTVQELADEFGISRRTMLRDLHALSEMGVPLAATPGPHGGYRVMRDRRLLPLALSTDEAIAILLSYESFLQYADSPFSSQSLSAITKLRAALPPGSVRELDRIREHVVIMEVIRSTPAPLLADVLRAVLDRVHLDIVYDSSSGLSERRIYPHGLFASHGFWYCVCYDHRRESTLALRADRIRSLRSVPGLDSPDVISVRDWLRTYRSGATEMLAFRAVAGRRAARNRELEALFGEITVDESHEAVIESSIPASELDFYASHLLALGPDIRVESPPELIDAIRRLARQTAALYTDFVKVTAPV